MAEAPFCPYCRSAMGRRLDGGRERSACPACGYVAYRNPVPVAMVLARRGQEVLLTRRANEPLRGFWAPPAGYVELDETVEQAAVREVQEETGLEVALDGLLGVYSRAGVGVLFVVFGGRVTGGSPSPSEEALEVGFFPPAALPPQPPSHAGTQLDRWFLEVVEELLRGRGAGA
ncbi:MAG: NUDIX hydrolase [Armatimonadota bacterium]|nr:NUDIX hydrolase [Armatimonadota bacterium]